MFSFPLDRLGLEIYTELPASCIYLINLFNKTLSDSMPGATLIQGRQKRESFFLFSCCYNESQVHNDTAGW